jgi:hypothetical protein
MWGILLRGIVTAIGYVSGGWAISDIFNERQRTKQIAQSTGGAEPTFFDVLKNTAKQNWLKWVILTAFAAFIYFIYNKFFTKKEA